MMFLMPYSNFLLVSNDDAIKWSKKDAKVAICTEKLVYVLVSSTPVVALGHSSVYLLVSILFTLTRLLVVASFNI